MQRSLKIFLSVLIAAIALTLSLMSISLTSVSLATQSATNETFNSPKSSLLVAANTANESPTQLRPPFPASGVYSLYDTLTPSDVPTATYSWVEISNDYDNSWNLSRGGYQGTNDVSGNYAIGFPFPFYGEFYTQFRISEKGYIFFEDPTTYVGSGANLPGVIPNGATNPGINNFIAPFAGNIVGQPGQSRVYMRSDSSPRRSIIQFQDVVWCCGRYNPRTFQIILYPTGEIKMQYAKVTNFPGTLDDDKDVAVGLENLDGSLGDVYTQGAFIHDNANYWQDQMALRFVPQFSATSIFFAPNEATRWEDPGIAIVNRPALIVGSTEMMYYNFALSHSLVLSSNLPASAWEAEISYPTSLSILTNTYSVTPTFVVTVPDGAGINDVAVVTITALSMQGTVAFQEATFVLTYGPAQRDLQIVKSMDPEIAPWYNGAFRYRLEVSNLDYNNSDRAGVAQSVFVTDILASGLVLEDDNCNCITTSPHPLGTLLTMDLGDMNPYDTQNIVLEVRNLISSEAGGGGTGTLPLPGVVVTNTAYVTTTESIEVGPLDNNVSTYIFTTASEPISDLTIDKWYDVPNNEIVASGQPVPFRIEFYNQGNFPVTTATVIDILPEYTTFVSATITSHGPTYNPPELITPTITAPMSRTLIFTLPIVDNGNWNHTHLDIWVLIPQTVEVGTILTNTAIITDGISGASDQVEIIVTDNHVNPKITKLPTFDENGEVIPPEPGKDYTYWILYENRSSNTPIHNVIITDTLPHSMTLVSASDGQYVGEPVVSYTPGGTVILPPYGSTIFPGNQIQITWFGDRAIPPGGTDELMIIVHVDENVPPGTELANQVVMTYTSIFTPSDPNDSGDVITIETVSQIQGSYKIVDNANPVAGQIVEYTIVVSNASPTQTIDFMVADPLPIGKLTFIDYYTPSMGLVTVTGNSLAWSGTGLAELGSAALTFRARVAENLNTGDIVKNTATISSGEASINRIASLTVAGGVFGISSKVATPTVVNSGDIVTYTLTTNNTGLGGNDVIVTDYLPPEVTLIPNSFGPPSEIANVSSGPNMLTWTTYISAESSKFLTFQAIVTDALADGLPIVNTAFLYTGGSMALPLPATIYVSNPEFINSSKIPSDTELPSGSTLGYTIIAENSGSAGGDVVVVDTLPISISLNPSSFNPATATVTVSGNTFTWTTYVDAMSSKTLSFDGVITDNLANGTQIENVAWLMDDIGSNPMPLPATVVISNSAIANLSGSAKLVNYMPPLVSGNWLTYTLVASNSGSSSSPVVITDTLSTLLVLDPTSFVSSKGTPVANGNAFTWSVTVGADQEETLSFQAQVAPDVADGTTILNTAYLFTDTLFASLPLTASVIVSNPIFVDFSKTVNPTEVQPNDVVTYTLTASNNGSVAGPITIFDHLATGLTLNTNSITPSNNVISNSSSFTWTPTLEANSMITLTFQVTVNNNVADGQVIDNFAYLESAALATPMVASNSITVSNYNFVAFSKTVNPTQVEVGDTVTYTLSISNSGSLAESITIVDNLVNELSLIANSITPNNDVISNSNSFTWTPTVEANSMITLTFQATVSNVITDGLIISNTGWLIQPDVASTTAIITVSVSQPADLSTSDKVASVNTVTTADTFSYTITARNTAGGEANITVVDTLPSELDLVNGSFVASSGTVAGNNPYTWSVTLAGNSEESLSFYVSVNNTAVDGNLIVNSAVLSGAELDTSYTLSDTVMFREADFSTSSKTASVAMAMPGDIFSYTLTVSNTGTASRTISVNDTLPNGVSLVANSLSPSSEAANVLSANNVLTWTTMVDGLSQKTLTFRVQVDETIEDGTLLTNYATLQDSYTLESVDLGPAVVVVSDAIFSGFSKQVKPTVASGGDVVTYTITITNTGTAAGNATINDNLPNSLTLIANSFNPPTGVTVQGNGFTWVTSVNSMSTAQLTFHASVDEGLADGSSITNIATLSSTYLIGTGSLAMPAILTINEPSEGIIYLPIVLR